MRSFIFWPALVLALAVATAVLGWWTVPVLAAAFGASRFAARRAWWIAALAGSVAWALLLAVSSLQGPVAALADKLGGVFGLPGFAVIGLTLIFPAVLAGSAAELAAALRAALAGSAVAGRSGSGV
jgi:hypothetical protein